LLGYNHGWSCKQSVVYAYLHFKCNDSWLYDQKIASKEDLQTFYSNMHKRHSVCKISHDYIQATVCWWHVPGRQQKNELIRDRIRWAV
jgi:hypothetical protein